MGRVPTWPARTRCTQVPVSRKIKDRRALSFPTHAGIPEGAVLLPIPSMCDCVDPEGFTVAKLRTFLGTPTGAGHNMSLAFCEKKLMLIAEGWYSYVSPMSHGAAAGLVESVHGNAASAPAAPGMQLAMHARAISFRPIHPSPPHAVPRCAVQIAPRPPAVFDYVRSYCEVDEAKRVYTVALVFQANSEEIEVLLSTVRGGACMGVVRFTFPCTTHACMRSANARSARVWLHRPVHHPMAPGACGSAAAHAQACTSPAPLSHTSPFPPFPSSAAIVQVPDDRHPREEHIQGTHGWGAGESCRRAAWLHEGSTQQRIMGMLLQGAL